MAEHVCFVSPKLYCYLEPGANESAGGAERQQYMIARELRDRGYDVSLVVADYGQDDYERIDGFDVWRGFPDNGGRTSAVKKPLQLIQTLRRVDADVYYARGSPINFIYTWMHCARSDDDLVYVVANDADVEKLYWDWTQMGFSSLYMRALEDCQQVVTLTEHQQSVLREEHDITNTRVIPCGYTLPDDSELAAADEREYVLWVGRLDPDQKKPSRFLELARQLPDVEFCMVGGPNGANSETYDRIEREAEEIPNLRFEGFVPPDDVHGYFRNAIALVNTSDYEGFGNVFLEAWRYATPVVSLHYTLDGVIDAEPVGYHSETMERLVADVRELVEDERRRREFGENGRSYLRDNYEMNTIVDRYEELFGELDRGQPILADGR